MGITAMIHTYWDERAQRANRFLGSVSVRGGQWVIAADGSIMPSGAAASAKAWAGKGFRAKLDGTEDWGPLSASSERAIALLMVELYTRLRAEIDASRAVKTGG
jgi:hypothetical protein